MTRVIRKHWPAVLAMAALAIGTAAVLPLVAERRAPRQIVLVANGMAFTLEGQSRPNPTLTIKAGERVEIVLRNETPGIEHDFAIPAWKVAVEPIAKGARTSVVVDAPQEPGRYEYECRPHALMMRGVLEVVAP